MRSTLLRHVVELGKDERCLTSVSVTSLNTGSRCPSNDSGAIYAARGVNEC